MRTISMRITTFAIAIALAACLAISPPSTSIPTTDAPTTTIDAEVADCLAYWEPVMYRAMMRQPDAEEWVAALAASDAAATKCNDSQS